jgi:hypothetical protein
MQSETKASYDDDCVQYYILGCIINNGIWLTVQRRMVIKEEEEEEEGDQNDYPTISEHMPHA